MNNSSFLQLGLSLAYPWSGEVGSKIWTLYINEMPGNKINILTKHVLDPSILYHYPMPSIEKRLADNHTTDNK